MSRQTELNAERATGLAMQEVNRRIADDRERISDLSWIVKPSDVADIMQPDFQAITDITENQIASVYLESYYRECYEIQDQLGYYWKPRKMNASNVRAFVNNKIAGENWKDRLQGHYLDYTQSISLIKTLGTLNGIPADEVEAMIDKQTGTIGECGLTYKIMRIMRTESNNAVNRGAVAAYKQCGVTRYKVIAILDDKLCEWCYTERHERVYSISEAKTGDTLPPFHPNCRCYTEPVVDNDTLRKAQQKGKSGKLSYEEWRRLYVDEPATDQKSAMPGKLKDVTKELLKNAKPGEGSVTIDDKTEPGDQETTRWLHRTFGGDIHCLAEDSKTGKMPDAIWKGNYWEYKSPTKINAIDRRIRDGNRQLAEALAREGRPDGERGLVIDIKGIAEDRDEAIKEIQKRAQQRLKGPTTIIIKSGEEYVMAFRSE